MKVVYTTRDGRLTAEIEGSTQAEVWENLANFQDVFENTTCTKNGESSDDVRFVVRQDDEQNKYYELRVNSGPLRGTRKSYGVHKKGGGLFPKSKDSEGNWLPDNGWMRWNPTTKKEE